MDTLGKSFRAALCFFLSNGTLEPTPRLLSEDGLEQTMSDKRNVNYRQSDGSEDGLRATPETTRVRQGVTGHNVRYVLGFGLTAAIFAMILIGIFVGWNRP